MTTAGFEQARAPECGSLFSRWRALTVGLLILGYAGYYLCRSDLSLTIPLLTAELMERRLGWRGAFLSLASGAVTSSGAALFYSFNQHGGGQSRDERGGRSH